MLAMIRWLSVVAALPLLWGCAAMHEEMVRQMVADGDPRAGCYQACDPGDVICTSECDQGHQASQPRNATQDLGDDIMGSAMSGNVTEADVDRLHRKQKDAMKYETGQGLVRGGSAPSKAPVEPDAPAPATPDPTSCPEGCPEGQRCVTLLAGTKQCATGGQCTTVSKTHSVCRRDR
jgi:hypothetical protein